MARKANYDNWDDRKCAKKYAYDHGYYGMIGGWIYDEKRPAIIRGSRDPDVTAGKTTLWYGKPICQGWDNFYRLYGSNIRAYINRLKAEQNK